MSSVAKLESPDLETQIGYLFKALQSGLRDTMDRALQEIELTTPVYAALFVLQQHPGISKADLARMCFVKPQSMTRVMATMMEAGLVSRAAHPVDGRILRTRLTKKGHDRLAEATRTVDGIMNEVLAGFSIAERRQFLAMLASCSDQLGARRPPPKN